MSPHGEARLVTEERWHHISRLVNEAFGKSETDHCTVQAEAEQRRGSRPRTSGRKGESGSGEEGTIACSPP